MIRDEPALEWVMEREVVKYDRKSDIVGDANYCTNETFSDPKYTLFLSQRAITVSLETMKIIKTPPGLNID